MMIFSKRMELFKSGIFSELAEMRDNKIKEGMRVIDLSVGTPNIPPAKHLIDKMVSETSNPKNYVYSISDIKELREAASKWYKRRYNVTLNPETEIVSLCGSQEGLTHIALALVDEGDTVLVPDPCYPAFADGPKIAGAELYYMPQKAENDYVINLNDIPEAVAVKAKYMLVSYPNNPTTAIAPDSFYHELIKFAKKYNIIVIHDNAYSELVFDGKKGKSFLSFDGAIDVGVEFNSLSKTYGLAGARIGFCVGNNEVIEKLTCLKSNMDYGMFLPIQKTAIAAITGDQSCVYENMKTYEHRRDKLCDGLNSIGWITEKSQATMFVWTSLPNGYSDSVSFCRELLDKAGVLVTPGSAFGPSGEGYVRMALVRTDEEIDYAVSQIKRSEILK